MVRPAYPLPLPYLGPPSPLSSSPTAPGASRSCHRPSLWWGPHRALLHRAATPPRSRPSPSVSPTSALLARCPPSGPHELVSNTLLLASHHQAVTERGLRVVTTHPTRLTRAQTTWARGPLRGWTGPPGRGPASLSIGLAWQAATPVDCDPGPNSARYYVANF
jgi:hypothetical protein